MFTYTYDSADRLTSATPSDHTAHPYKMEAGYDDQGRRIWKKSYQWDTRTNGWQLSEYRKFVYDGWNLVAEFSQDPQGLDRLIRTYAWGQDLGGGIGGLLSITTYQSDGVTPDKTYLPLYDASGNVTGLADASTGNVVASYEYDPFGNPLAAYGDQAALNANPFRFSTKYFDAETGLYYYGYRYYSAQLGRWMTRDPIQEAGGVDVYAFVGNDPVNGIDPLGLDEFITVSSVLKDPIGSFGRVGRALEVLGHPSLGKTLQVGEGVGRFVKGQVVNTVINAGNPAAPIVGQLVGTAKDVQSLQPHVGSYDAIVIGTERNAPLLGSIVSGTEIYDGRSLSGADFGRQLDVADKAERATGIVVDVGSLIVVPAAVRGRTGVSGTSPKSVGARPFAFKPRFTIQELDAEVGRNVGLDLMRADIQAAREYAKIKAQFPTKAAAEREGFGGTGLFESAFDPATLRIISERSKTPLAPLNRSVVLPERPWPIGRPPDVCAMPQAASLAFDSGAKAIFVSPGGCFIKDGRLYYRPACPNCLETQRLNYPHIAPAEPPFRLSPGIKELDLGPINLDE